MRFGLPAVALALLLLTAVTARAQSLDGGGNTPGAFTNAAAAQTYFLLELYRAQMQQLSAMPQVDQDEIAKRAAEYFTNGAQATAVPTSGPGAAYFQNGAAVTAASTAQAIPFGQSAFPSAEVNTANASVEPAQGSVPAPSGPSIADAETAPAAASAATAADGSTPGARAPTPPPATPNPGEPVATTLSPALPESPTAAAPRRGMTATEGTALAALADATADSSTKANRSMMRVAPLLGAIALAALLVFLSVFAGVRLRGRRGPTI